MIKLQKFHAIYTKRYDSSNRWSIGTNCTIGTNRKGCSVGEQQQFGIQTCHENSSFYQPTRWKRANNCYEYSSFYKPTTQNNFTLTQSRNALIVTKRGRTSANSNCRQL